ncbi:MAG TPA: hypothetical protein PKZ53_22805, partial [Acidobacteriota bacterium]|nr:hypothetical protein [Acidobacteriota bacterium]
NQLSEDARKYFEIVCLAGKPISRHVIQKAATIQHPEPLIVAELRARNLILIRQMDREHNIEVYHDRIREAVLKGISRDRRRALHCALAETLIFFNQGDPEQLAIHYFEAERFGEALYYTIQAAELAEANLALDHATFLYQRADALRFLGKKPSDLD